MLKNSSYNNLLKENSLIHDSMSFKDNSSSLLLKPFIYKNKFSEINKYFPIKNKILKIQKKKSLINNSLSTTNSSLLINKKINKVKLIKNNLSLSERKNNNSIIKNNFYNENEKNLIRCNSAIISSIKLNKTKKLIDNKKINSFINKQSFNLFNKGISKDFINNFYKKKDISVKKYQIIGNKNILKNIIPKQIEHNTILSSNDILKSSYHPITRLRQTLKNKNMNRIAKEVFAEYSNYFKLVNGRNFSKKFRINDNINSLENSNKFKDKIEEYNKIGKIIEKSFKLDKEVNDVYEQSKKLISSNKKKIILSKFREVIIRASIHFKRLNLKFEEFMKTDKKIPHNQRTSIIFIQAIRDKNYNKVIEMVQNNFLLALDFDDFNQTPLHWCAKRNLYQCISLIVSKGANINAKDLGGRTPMHIAVKNNAIESLEVILYELGNPFIKDNMGLMPIDYSEENSDIKFILRRSQTLHKLAEEQKNKKKYEDTIKSGIYYLFMNELNTNFKEVKEYIYDCLY